MSVGIIASSVVVSSGVDVLFEPFNNFTAAPWSTNGSPTIIAGRTGTAANMSGSLQIATYTIPVPSRSDTATVGVAFKWTDAQTTTRNIIDLRAGGQVHNRVQVITTTGQLVFTRGVSAAVGTSAAGLVVANTWYYLEFKSFMSDTVGYCLVRLNGVEVINVSGVDTSPTTEILYNELKIGSGTTSVVQQYDDLYLSTGAGATFKGPITIP